MNLKTKRMICLLVAIISILTIVGTISYAYFTAVGETRPQQATLNTATVSVTFSDNDAGISRELDFGESLIKKFTIENTGTADAHIKMNWVDMVNTYLEGSLTYTLSYSENEEGPYTEAISKTNVPQSENPSKKTLASSLTIPVSKTYYYNLVITLNYLEDVNQDADINATFHSKFNVKDINNAENVNTSGIVNKIKSQSQGVRTSFNTAAKTDEGIFEMEDDYGTSYYYRGAVENNYVKFGKWAEGSTMGSTDMSGKDMWWRIIRINGDGSIRMIYDGTQGYSNANNGDGSGAADRYIATSVAWNATNNDDNKYVGYMYGGANGTKSTQKDGEVSTAATYNETSTNIKTVIDTWYETNLKENYDKYISDSIFCNDRSTPGITATGWTYDTGEGFGTNYTAYGAYARSGVSLRISSVSPSFKCPQKNDAFTVDDTEKGNGSLTNKVGLITVDEVVAAGGKWGTNNTHYYLYKNSSYWYWSLSPYYYNAASVFMVHTSGNLNYNNVNNSGAVAPVINLSAEYASQLVGSGTTESPYQLPEVQ